MFDTIKGVLDSLSRKQSRNLSAVQNGNTPQWCINHMLWHSSPLVQREIVVHRTIPHDVAMKLVMGHKNWGVRTALAKHSTDSAVLGCLVNDMFSDAHIEWIVNNPNLLKKDIVCRLDAECYANPSRKKAWPTAAVSILLSHQELTSVEVDSYIRKFIAVKETKNLPFSTELLMQNRKASPAAIAEYLFQYGELERLYEEEHFSFYEFSLRYLEEELGYAHISTLPFPADYATRIVYNHIMETCGKKKQDLSFV